MNRELEVYAGAHGVAGHVISRALDDLLDRASIPWRASHATLNMGMPYWVRRTCVGGPGDIVVESSEIFTAHSPLAGQWLGDAVALAHRRSPNRRAVTTSERCQCGQ